MDFMLEIIQRLPDPLKERVRLVKSNASPASSPRSPRNSAATPRLGRSSDSPLVVYWMRTAVRIDENPALDVARWLAAELQGALLVYHGLNENYKYASDRHHTFILEGACDVQQQCREAGLSYAFCLSTPRDRRPHLWELADQAVAVVTEEMPVDPPRHYLKTLAAHTNTPLLAVDTACVVPMQLISKAYTRAFEFRDATKKLYAQRISRDWPQFDLVVRPFDLQRLPFEPLELDWVRIPDWVAECEIDHSVGPVAGTRGGTTAGYRRWEHFLKSGIYGYAKRRNDPVQDGVSRMSAYLHYGMVSPLRIARQAAAIDHPGAEKYLDELLIWRELAYSFCFHRPDHDQWTAIPAWAQATLLEHSGDLRPAVYSWESLARGQTDDPLWNAAQRSLLRHGELHNNLRMTWGKAILNWTETPQQALAMMIDLNHRYALDGRDPCSYGGLLWCLGQFDRPFTPPTPILGTVRPRPLAEHANRLQVPRYIEKIDRWGNGRRPRVGVIGGGISGLMAARTLADHGLQVTVFEKSRGLGGRMATRRVEGVPMFDHGAQYFTARDPRFERYLRSWAEQGRVAPWPAADLSPAEPKSQIVSIRAGQIESVSDSVQRWVAVPGMNRICRHLAEPHPNLQIELETRIESIETVSATSDQDSPSVTVPQIEVRSVDGRSWGPFDRLIVSAPAGQTAELLNGISPMAQSIAEIKMAPCWAAMVRLPVVLPVAWVGAFLQDSCVAWVARNQTKAGRSGGADFGSTEQLVLHANPVWTTENWNREGSEVAAELLAEFWRVTGLQPIPPLSAEGHRWKFSIPTEPLAVDSLPRELYSPGCFYDPARGIAACGDWANGARVEGAFLSGMAAAGRILGSFRQPKEFTDSGEPPAAAPAQLRLF